MLLSSPSTRRALRLLRRASPLLALLVAATLAMLVGYLLRRPSKPDAVPPGQLEVVVVNVGQGEASYIRTPDGKFIVIGAGSANYSGRVIDSLRKSGAKKIDLLVLPYPYAEAMGSAPELIRAFPVALAVEPGEARIINRYQEEVRALLREGGVPLRHGRAGDWFKVSGVRIDILAPAEPLSQSTPAAANNSLVTRLSWRNIAFLWAGGIEKAGELALLSRTPDLSAHWLRVARFGTREASSLEFLRLVSPEIAVISVGTNTGGYPHDETLERLEMMGARILRTDEWAKPEMRFWSDGERVFGP